MKRIPRCSHHVQLRRLTLASLVSIVGFVATPQAQAVVQVYEGFNYTPFVAAPTAQSVAPGLNPVATNNTAGNVTNAFTLNGQSGGTGFATPWTAGATAAGNFSSTGGFIVNDPSNETLWNGTSTSVTQTGFYAGSPVGAGDSASGYNGNTPDNMWASRQIAPSVTSSFTLGSTTWMGYIQSSNFKANGNTTGGMFALGSGYFNSAQRGNKVDQAGMVALGVGINYTSKRFTAAYWTDSTSASSTGTLINATSPTVGTPFSNTSNGLAQIGLAKIVWGDAVTPTTITVGAFTDGAVLTEAAFDALTTLSTNTATVDPTTFNYISVGGARFNVDELRIGTTFNDAIGLVISASGPYWAPGATGGGTGTWAAGSNVWASSPGVMGTGSQSTSATLLFTGTAGTATIDGTVSATTGINFQASGFVVAPGASTPLLNLTGPDATANTITVNTGTAAINANVGGTNGLTKTGAGTLVLGSTTNTYGGGTVLNTGTLQIAAVASLGTGNVSFLGGTLQYPTGAGPTAIDVSSKIPTVALSQVANIDTNGNDVTFNNAIGGQGGLTKFGTGSLTLAAANTFTGPTSVSGGTLNVSSASGTVATLNVLTGGTANLNSGTTVTNLNVAGGTAVVAAAGLSVTNLVATSGTLDASANPVSVTASAQIRTVTVTGTTPFSLSGANVVSPTSGSPSTLTSGGGTLNFVTNGLMQAVGVAGPGANTIPGTTVNSGGGVWSISDAVVATPGNVYGKDNAAFHYMEVPSGDFVINAHVTSSTSSQPGIMIRDTLASAPAPTPIPPDGLPVAPAGTGNWVGIWKNRMGSTTDGANPTVANLTGPSGTGNTPYLRITKVGNDVTSYYSQDGITYTQGQMITAPNWGATTYLGLNVTDTATGGGSGAFDLVDFMGTASMSDWSTTNLNIPLSTTLALPGGKIRFGDLTISAGQTVTLGSTGSVSVNNLTAPSNTVITNTAAGDTSFGVRGSGTYGGLITESSPRKIAFVKDGPGAFTLTGANVYSGGNTVNGGTLTLSTLGSTTGPLAVNNPNVDAGTAVVLNLPTGVNSSTGSLSGAIAVPGSGVNTATINNGGAGTSLTVNQTTAGSYDGSIAGAGSFVLAATSNNTLKLNGESTYTGGTSINGGALLVNNTSGSGTGTGPVTVASTATLGGTGTISGATTVSGAVAPGNAGVGTLNVGSNVTWNAGSSWVYELDSAGPELATPGTSDLLNLTGNFGKGTGSTFTFNFSGTGQVGWYKLVDWTGTTSFNASNFAATNFGEDLGLGGFTVDVGTSALYVNVVSANRWQGSDPTNLWSATASWTNGDVPNTNTEEALFSNAPGATLTSILDTNQTINALTFKSTNDYMISPAAAQVLSLTGTSPTISTSATNTGMQTVLVDLSLGNGTTIAVNGGSLNLNVPATNPVLGTGVTATVALGATLNLGGAGNALSNGTTTHANVTNNGTLAATTAGKRVGHITGTGTTDVTAASATLTASSIRQAGLTIGAGNKVTVAPNGTDTGVSRVTSLSIDTTGQLDLNNNDLIVDNGNLAAVTLLLQTGLDITGAYGGGPGITSTTFAANPLMNTALGVAPNSELGYGTFSGQAVDANDILVKYTYFGDADLNGVVDTATDFDLYITGLTSGGSLGGWLYGDFDYNGVVDSATDFDLYVTGLSSQSGALLTTGPSPIQAVPEPGTLVLGGLALLGLTAAGLRRRRHAVAC